MDEWDKGLNLLSGYFYQFLQLGRSICLPFDVTSGGVKRRVKEGQMIERGNPTLNSDWQEKQ